MLRCFFLHANLVRVKVLFWYFPPCVRPHGLSTECTPKSLSPSDSHIFSWQAWRKWLLFQLACFVHRIFSRDFLPSFKHSHTHVWNVTVSRMGSLLHLFRPIFNSSNSPHLRTEKGEETTLFLMQLLESAQDISGPCWRSEMCFWDCRYLKHSKHLK